MNEQVHAEAWALKEACYTAWHTSPGRAADAAGRLATLSDRHAGDTLLSALADWTAGIAALASGDLPEALLRLQQAQDGFQARDDLQHAAETQVPQMVALSMLGRDAEALACARKALAQFEASGDARSAAKIEGNLGTMHSRQDRHREAEAHWRRAGVRFARLGDLASSVAADIALANALTWQFRFDEALRVNERARMRARTHGLDVLHAHARQAIGRIELNRGRWHGALAALSEALDLLTAAEAPPQRRIEAEAALADAYLAVHLLDEAVVLYDRIRAEAATWQAPTERAWATLQRARALGRLGDHAGALEGLAQARTLYLDAGNAATVAYTDLCRGRVELASGDPTAALASARAAAAGLQGLGITGWSLDARALEGTALAASGQGEAALQVWAEVIQAGTSLPQVRLPCHTGVGQIALARGDLATARNALETALALVDRERAALPDDDLRSALAADSEQAHEALIDVALAEGDTGVLLRDLERGRARALAWSLPGVGAGAAMAAPAESTRLQWLRDQWRQAMAEGDADRLPGLDGQMRALETELLEAHRRSTLQRTDPDAAGSPRPAGRSELDLPELLAGLPDDTALVVWHLHGTRLLAVVLAGGQATHHDLPAGDLQARIQALRFQIETWRGGGSALLRHAERLTARTQAHAQALHQLLWAPIEHRLEGRRRVVLMPHRELHYLPFAALHDGQRWLVQTRELSLAPSLTAFQQGVAARDRFRALLAVGVGGHDLPHVAREIAGLVDLFGADATVLQDAHATPAALAGAAPAADILHLACHGRFRADNPAFSSLQLGNGPLSLHEARQLPLNASLVTLSACSTGLSRLAPGDEVQGLVRAFMLAGASRVLATLWPVADQPSADLMTDFYRALRAGDRPSLALQRAQAAAADRGAPPFHWAAFTLHARG